MFNGLQWASILFCFVSFCFQDKGHSELYNHEIMLNADRYTLANKDLVVTGQFQPVSGTDYDLRVEQNLGKAIARLTSNGYDDNFCVTRGTDQSLAFVARYVLHEKRHIILLPVSIRSCALKFLYFDLPIFCSLQC